VLTGAIDVPFAPHQENAGRLVTDRGPGRRVRVLDPGALPLSPAHVRRERQLLGARATGGDPLWQRLLSDVRILA
jgi:methylaspartate mutase epsilon subunit